MIVFYSRFRTGWIAVQSYLRADSAAHKGLHSSAAKDNVHRRVGLKFVADLQSFHASLYNLVFLLLKKKTSPLITFLHAFSSKTFLYFFCSTCVIFVFAQSLEKLFFYQCENQFRGKKVLLFLNNYFKGQCKKKIELTNDFWWKCISNLSHNEKPIYISIFVCVMCFKNVSLLKNRQSFF